MGEVEEEWLARGRLDHAYYHRCCKEKTADDLPGSMSLKRHSKYVWIPM